jgi:sulfite reductase (ferredoxin)
MTSPRTRSSTTCRASSRSCATGCPSWCTYPEINDIGADARRARRRSGLLAARGRRTFERAASCCASMPSCGPIRRPRGARRHGDLPRSAGPAREPRSRPPQVPLHARRLDAGELPRRAELAHRFQARSSGVPEIPDDSLRDHVGIHPQRQPGLAYVGASGAARPHDRRAA